MKKCILGIILLTGLLYLAIEYQYQNIQLAGFETQNKLWIHRGGKPENTIAGINQSLKDGFHGVEIDLQFDESNKTLLIGHDKLKEGEEPLPSLEAYLSNLKESQIDWWFDLKNLNNENANEISNLLKQFEKRFNLSNRYFIESDQFFALNKLASKNIPTVFWINPHTKSRIFFLRKIENKLKLLFSNFIGVSIYYESYNEKARDYLELIPKFIFTVNGDLKDQYLNDNSIQVVLTDDQQGR